MLVRHYGPFLKGRGVNLFIADGAVKQRLVDELALGDRIEADKIDVVLTGDMPYGERFFGVVHVKASFAETTYRRCAYEQCIGEQRLHVTAVDDGLQEHARNTPGQSRRTG